VAIVACIEGTGFGVFMSYQVAPFLKTGRLVVVLADFEPPVRPIQPCLPARPPVAQAHTGVHRVDAKRASGIRVLTYRKKYPT
jgi:DNA-binding transcriptional LysR family regulator